MDRFFFPATTGNHSDVFAVVGLATLLRPAANCTIRAVNGGFEVAVDPPLDWSRPIDLDCSPGYLYLKPNDKATVPRGVGEFVDYPAEKRKVDAYREARKVAREAGTEVAEEVDANRPRADWRLYQALNALQGDDAANKIIEAMSSISTADWKSRLGQALDARQSNRKPEVPWSASLVQLFSPHAAKGYARLKPDGTGRGDKTKDAWADPLTEWLRVRGFFAAACPFFCGSKGEHVRLLCPVPRNIEAGALMDVVTELRQAPVFGSAAKIDCVATLELARLLIRHFREQKSLLLEPDALISRILIANYQSMGQAKAITAMESLAVPGWFPLTTEADADLWTATLEEHENVIRRLRDDRSDEIGLILAYRRFLEHRGAQSIHTLLSFAESYGIFLLRERARDTSSRRKQFRTDHMEAILNQQNQYKSLIDNAGLRAVAAAIRSATVSAQYLKTQRKDHREIRYDLLPELRRKRSLPGVAPFLEAVAEFVCTYNAESARRLEQGKTSGVARVSTEDMESFTGLLLEQKDASVLGALLCAYATCRVPAPGGESESEPEDQSEGEA